MAVGLLRPDAGRSEVLGVDVQADPMRARQLMGVLPDGLAMPERLGGRELLTLIGGHGQQQQRQLLRPVEHDHAQVAGIIGASRVVGRVGVDGACVPGDAVPATGSNVTRGWVRPWAAKLLRDMAGRQQDGR